MRIILQVIFRILVILIWIERSIRSTFSLTKKFFSRLRRRVLRSLKRLNILPGNPVRGRWRRARRLKPKVIFRRRKRLPRLVPFRSKLMYLSYGIVLSLIFFFLPLVIVIFLQDLPNPEELTLRQIPQTTKIFDRNGVLLAQIFATQNRTIIPLSDVPKVLQEATIAIEDKNFYQHPGFDLPSIFRAIKIDVAGKSIQGGSTITQQLIKSSILTSEQSYSRKIKEIILAFWSERIYSKNQILEMYFNQVPYGGTAWGIEAASQTYFAKSAKNLDLAESAFLAGLTSAPSTYSPYGNNPQLWKKRQKEVLKRMIALNFISAKEAQAAGQEELHFTFLQNAIHAPHFVNYIENLVAQKYGLPMLEKGGLNITTSLDVKIEEMAEKVVKEEVDNNGYLNLTNGAALVTDPRNGDILAMVGSRDFNDPNGGNFNVALSLRQPGSSIKVVTYAAALENGFTAATTIDDSPVTFSGYNTPYSPVNYDGKFHGRVPLRFALANSLNIPAVKTLNQVGIPTMVNTARKMGITSWGDAKQYGLSITLGAAEVTMLDMARVYGTLADGGRRVDLNPILKITDNSGNVFEQKSQPVSQTVLKSGTAFIMSDILADNQSRSMEFGPNSPLNIPGHYVSVKTGTTDSKRDNWTDGYTDKYVVIVWVGNNDNTPMSPVLASGITGAAPIWHRIMTNLVTESPEVKPAQPTEVVQKFCGFKNEYFISGTENIAECARRYPTPTASIKIN